MACSLIAWAAANALELVCGLGDLARAEDHRRVGDLAPAQRGVHRHRVLVERDGSVGERLEERRRAVGPLHRQRIVDMVGRELRRHTLGERRVEVRSIAVGGDDRDHPLLSGAGGVGGRQRAADRVGDARAGRAARRRPGPGHPARRRLCGADRAAYGRGRGRPSQWELVRRDRVLAQDLALRRRPAAARSPRAAPSRPRGGTPGAGSPTPTARDRGRATRRTPRGSIPRARSRPSTGAGSTRSAEG